MARALLYMMLVAGFVAGCGRDDPPKPKAAASPPPTVAPEKPAEAPASAQPAQPKAAAAAPSTRKAERPAAGGGTYTVQRGDTLQAIAKKHGVDYRDVAKWNNIRDPGRIRVGQELRMSPPGK